MGSLVQPVNNQNSSNLTPALPGQEGEAKTGLFKNLTGKAKGCWQKMSPGEKAAIKLGLILLAIFSVVLSLSMLIGGFQSIANIPFVISTAIPLVCLFNLPVITFIYHRQQRLGKLKWMEEPFQQKNRRLLKGFENEREELKARILKERKAAEKQEALVNESRLNYSRRSSVLTA